MVMAFVCLLVPRSKVTVGVCLYLYFDTGIKSRKRRLTRDRLFGLGFRSRSYEEEDVVIDLVQDRDEEEEDQQCRMKSRQTAEDDTEELVLGSCSTSKSRKRSLYSLYFLTLWA